MKTLIRLSPYRLIALTAILAAILSHPFASEAPPPSPEAPSAVDITLHYIPRADVHRTPYHSESGAFLPLSELRELAERAHSRSADAPTSAAVYCQSLELRGQVLSDSQAPPYLKLQGALRFQANHVGWSATLIDDGGVPWTEQGPTAGSRGFLARLAGRTYLFAQGPGNGALELTALCPIVFESDPISGQIPLGRIRIPTRLTIEENPAFKLVAQKGLTASIPEKGELLFWPLNDGPAIIQATRQTEFEADLPPRIEIQRIIRFLDTALWIQDTIEMNRLTGQTRIHQLPLPEGFDLRRAHSPTQAILEREGDHITITPPDEDERVVVALTYWKSLNQPSLTLPGYGTLGAGIQSGTIRVIDSDQGVLEIGEGAGTLHSIPTNGSGVRVYSFIGALPALSVHPTRYAPPVRPVVQADMTVDSDRGELTTRLDFFHRNPSYWEFIVPDDWTLDTVASWSMDGIDQPYDLQSRPGGLWRVTWSQPIVQTLIINLRRQTAWTADGESARHDLAFLRFPDQILQRYDIALQWPGSLQVRLSHPVDLEDDTRPLDATAQASQGPAPEPPLQRADFRVTGPHPAIRLSLAEQSPNVTAQIGTVLSVLPDRVTVKALFDYRVKQAPTNTFRFTVPAPAATRPRIEGESIREQTIETIDGRRVATLTTQDLILGPVQFTVQWTEYLDTTTQTVQAPDIQALDVVAQDGYIVLEGSRNLRLTMTGKGLADAEMADLPPLPWKSDNRILAVYRRAAPTHELRIQAKSFDAQPGIGALAHEAAILTTITPEGERFTQGHYTVATDAEKQFFEFSLPENATLWSAMIDGVGVKPSRRSDPEEGERILLPLPPSTRSESAYDVTIVYRESGPSLTEISRLSLTPPRPVAPVNRASWKLRLPEGFAYLAMRDARRDWRPLNQSTVAWLRTAHYPSRLLFLNASGTDLLAWTLLVIILVGSPLVGARLWRTVRRRFRKQVVSLAEAEAGAPVDEPTTEPEPEASSVPDDARPPKPPSGCLRRIIELSVVAFILFILFLIAVPNFLESQVRGKSSRIQADLRSIATGLENYFNDHNQYPTQLDTLWQGPVYYLSSGLMDPFAATQSRYASAGSGAHYQYIQGPEALRRAQRIGYADPSARPDQPFFMIYSIGPDGVDQNGTLVYDPANGSESAGDIIRVSSRTDFRMGQTSRFSQSQHDSYRAPLQKKMADAASQIPMAANQPVPPPPAQPADELSEVMTANDVMKTDDAQPEYRRDVEKPQRGAQYVGDRERQNAKSYDRGAIGGDTLAPGAGGAPPYGAVGGYGAGGYGAGAYAEGGGYGGGAFAGRVAGPQSGVVAGAPYSNATAQAWMDMDTSMISPQTALGTVSEERLKEKASAATRATQAGLLSLDIEIPIAGSEQEVTTLGDAPAVEIRLMNGTPYAQLRFLFRAGAFILLLWIWGYRRPWYGRALILVAAITLWTPVLIQTIWVEFFNATCQGAFASLVAPLGAVLIRRLGRPNSIRMASPLILMVLSALTFPGAAGAEPGDQTSPIHIIVPYDLDQSPYPWVGKPDSDPMAFIAQDDFARLWTAAQGAPRAIPSGPEAMIIHALLEGRLDDRQAVVEGRLIIRAVNPSSKRQIIGAGFSGLTIQSPQAHPKGAFIRTQDKALALDLPAQWDGVLSCQIQIPCDIQGATGRLQFHPPPDAVGLWRIVVPYARVESTVGDPPRPVIQQSRGGATLLSGALGDATLSLQWNVPQGQDAGLSTAAGDESNWKARLTLTARLLLNKAASARGLSRYDAPIQGAMALSPADGARPLSRVIRLRIPESLHITTVHHPALRSARREGAELVLELSAAPTATITFAGYWTPEARIDSGQQTVGWRLPALRAPEGIPLQTELILQTPEAWDAAWALDGLERRSHATPSAGRAYAFGATRQDWTIDVQLTPAPPALTAQVTEAFAPAQGALHHAARILLQSEKAPPSGITLRVPNDMIVLDTMGSRVANWRRFDDRLAIEFTPGNATQPPGQRIDVLILSRRPLDSTPLRTTAPSSAGITFETTPLTFVDPVDETDRRTLIWIGEDDDLTEVDIRQARSMTPGADDQRVLFSALTGQTAPTLSEEAPTQQGKAQQTVDPFAPTQGALPVERWFGAGTIRAYSTETATPLAFRLRRVRGALRSTFYNLATVSEGLRRLQCLVQSVPTQGRAHQVTARLILPEPAANAPARIETGGPVRSLETEWIDSRQLRIVARLDAPQREAFQIRFTYEAPVDLTGEAPVKLAWFAPDPPDANRALLLVRPSFDGELQPLDLVGARPLSNVQNHWPDALFTPQPADRALELPAGATDAPSFRVLRHQKTEALRSVVEILRQRTVLTPDGMERHEVEIVLQNKSEQFLNVTLPYPRPQCEMYQILVAGNDTPIAFAGDQDDDPLMIPLIRPGLLDPEIVIRIAYTADTGQPLGRRGQRAIQLPRIGGDIPIAQSTLLLTAPDTYGYKRFRGAMTQVDPLDLDAEEALRVARKAQRLSEIALNTSGRRQRLAAKAIGYNNAFVGSQIANVEFFNTNQMRNIDNIKDQEQREAVQQQAHFRTQVIQDAQRALEKSASNFVVLNQRLQAQTEQTTGDDALETAMEDTAPIAQTPPIVFPAVGETFAFRQLQGVGHVEFKYSARESASRRLDLFIASGLVLLFAGVVLKGGAWFATPRRAATLVLILAILAAGVGVAQDLALPLAVAAAACLLAWRSGGTPQEEE